MPVPSTIHAVSDAASSFTPSQREALTGAMEHVAPLRLVIIHGEPLGAVLTAVDDGVVGRDDSADLTILHGSISRRHASLHRDGGGWYVEDGGSTNGTFVNGARVTNRVPLRQGDIVAFGAVVLKVYVAERRAVADGGAASHVDPVTGTFTEAYLAARLDAEVAESYRRRQPISVACVSLDGFAEVARRCGDEVADAALGEVGDLLRDRLRRSDVLGRDGHDGFAAILVDVTLPIAVRIGRRLLKALRTHPIDALGAADAADLRIRASVGVASTEGRWLSAADLLQAGRDAGARARSRGGDRVRA